RTATISCIFLCGALLAGACGGDDDSGSSGGTSGGDASGAVVVEARDIDFDRSSYEAAAGEVTFRYVQEGNLEHTLLIEGVEGFKLAVNDTDEDEGTIELAAGTYTLYCDIPGHR